MAFFVSTTENKSFIYRYYENVMCTFLWILLFKAGFTSYTLIRACAQVIFEEWRKEVVAMLAVYGMAMRVVVVKFVAT